jgi:hypothetical protein
MYESVNDQLPRSSDPTCRSDRFRSDPCRISSRSDEFRWNPDRIPIEGNPTKTVSDPIEIFRSDRIRSPLYDLRSVLNDQVYIECPKVFNNLVQMIINNTRLIKKFKKFMHIYVHFYVCEIKYK